MKKYLMTLAAVLCCAMTTTMFVACGDDEEKSYDGYVYSVELDVLNSIGYSAEAATLQTAFYQAIGYDGNVYKTYNSSQDDAMKNACEAVKTQYANSIKSTFLRFYLVRDVIDVQGNRDKKTIAVYDFGTVTKTPHVKYSYATDYDEALSKWRTQKDSLDANVYKASGRTLLALSNAFNKRFSQINTPWPATEENDRAVKYICDSIFNAHANDTLTVDITFAAYKRGFPDGENAEIWKKTKQPNM